jgi:hypothetical protein
VVERVQSRAKDGNPRQAAARALRYVDSGQKARAVRFSIGKWLVRAIDQEHAHAFHFENALDIRRRGRPMCGHLCR